MGSYMNFKNSGEADGSGGNGNGVPHFSYPLVRQSSVYSLTFDEFQSTLGGSGKDFGSMNMEDLLKSIWTAEESQAVASSTGGGDGGAPAGNLQRQGSLTLPRTLSQKTVDEVWRDVLKEPSGGGGGSGLGLGPREPTLGEMTLEEFLSRAGVVREDNQPSVGPTGTGFYGSLSPLNGNNNAGFTIGFQQPSQNSIVLNPPNLGINMSGVTTSQPPPRPQLQPLFPKQTTLAFSSPTQIVSNAHISSPVAKGRMGNGLNNGVVQGGKMVMGGGSSNGVAAAVVAGGSPRNHMYSDSVGKNDTDSSSASPTPYHVGEGGRGRRSSSSLEKVVERRRRRMIKNRESAARSRARKQAYTLELESEIAKLKEKNQELQKKQEELVEMQKNQILESMNKQWGGKRRCLRRTVTGPW
ncbi:hypothetical protein ACP275_02G034700 [Erythranthe tilingii]